MPTPSDPTANPAANPPANLPPYEPAQIDKLLDSVRGLRHPQQIGAFHIIRVIGEGGMGVVYEAEQREPIKRTVAIKIIKLGMDTREVIARFESERQALAMMNHPNVAKVLDAGATENGRPYFVMEFVAGEPITRFCDSHQLSINQRLELLVQACDAVQHAHQKAIIHRDLKPSNILVTEEDGQPRVKVIDFGVAKAIRQRLTEKTLFTQTGQLVGTPEYMAPEQADVSGADVDTRSDVYSLGVVLYELLSGTLPFDATSLRSQGYQSILRIIRDVDPPRPSTRLSGLGNDANEIARLRQSSLENLALQLGGELEWIPLKAMRKDRGERYATATELAEDIHNYLSDRPLRAGPETALYRTKKFLRRNKAGVAASAAMLLLLIGGIVTTSIEASRARNAERETRLALQKATDANASMRAVNDFLTQDLLWSAEPERTRGREMTVREAVDIAARDVGQRFKDRPLVEASVRTALAGTYDKLGRTDLAAPHAHAAVEIIRQMHRENEPDGLDAFEVMGEVQQSEGKPEEAEKTLRETFDARRRTLGADEPATLNSELALGDTLRLRNNFVESEKFERDAIDRFRRTLGDENARTIDAQATYVSLLKSEGKWSDAEEMAHDVAATSRRVNGEDHPATIAAVARDAALLWRLGKISDAEPMMRKVIVDRERIEGRDHPNTISSTDALAMLLTGTGRLADAEELERGVVDRARRVMGSEHPLTLSFINNLGQILWRQGKRSESEALCREALAGNQKVLGKENLETLTVEMNLAFLLDQVGKTAEAESLLRESVAIQRRALGDTHPVTLNGINNLGGILFEQKRYSEAEAMFGEALAGRRKALGDSTGDTLATLSNYSRVIEAQGRLAEAEPLFAELYQRSATAQIDPRQAALFMSHWGEILARLGKYPQAEAPLRETINRLRATRQDRSEYMLRSLSALAEVCEHSNRGDEAAALRGEAGALRTATRPALASSPLSSTGPSSGPSSGPNR